MTGPVVPTPPAENATEVFRLAVVDELMTAFGGTPWVVNHVADRLLERVAERVRAARDEAREEINTDLLVLTLNNIADHLASGEAMNLAGEWRSDLIDKRRPSGRRSQHVYDRGWSQGVEDAVFALRWVARRNEAQS